MQKVFLVRHGAYTRIFGTEALTEQGIEQAKRAAELIKLEISGVPKIRSSRHERAIQTASVMAECLGVKFTPDMTYNGISEGAYVSDGFDLPRLIRETPSDTLADTILVMHSPDIAKYLAEIGFKQVTIGLGSVWQVIGDGSPRQLA